MKLYGHTNKRSFNTLKIRVALAEAEAAYEYVPIDLDAGEQMRPDFLRLNPHGKIPVLLDGDFALPESNAILWYVSEKFPRASLLPPQDFGDASRQGRARALQWVEFAASLYGYYADYWNHALREPEERDAPAAEAALARIMRSIGVLDTVLTTRDFLADNRHSVADLANASIVYALKRKLPSDPTIEAAHLRDWYERVVARPAWKSALG